MGEVELTREGAVAIITLAAPERRNAITPTMADELRSAVDEIDADGNVGAAVIQGAGGHFCAGADLGMAAELSADPASPEAYAALETGYESFVRFGQCAVPTVAAVRGSAIGAGTNLLLSADLRVIASDARILAGFLRIGVHPGGGHFVLAARQAGREATAALALFGEEIDGIRARELGLAWEAVDDEDVEGRALELAARAGDDPALSRRFVRSFRQELGPPMASLEVALEAERASQTWSLRRRGLSERDWHDVRR